MFRKITSNDKVAIRTLAMFIGNGEPTEGVVGKIDTGSNIYTIKYMYTPATGIKYCVSKHFVNGKYLGDVEIDSVSEYGIEYRRYSIGIPGSVEKAIKRHYVLITRYMNIGEAAFN